MAKSSIQGFVELARFGRDDQSSGSGSGQKSEPDGERPVVEQEGGCYGPNAGRGVRQRGRDQSPADHPTHPSRTENAMSGTGPGTVSAEVESLRRRVQDLAGQVEALATIALKQGEDAVAAGLAALPGAVSPGIRAGARASRVQARIDGHRTAGQEGVCEEGTRQDNGCQEDFGKKAPVKTTAAKKATPRPALRRRRRA